MPESFFGPVMLRVERGSGRSALPAVSVFHPELCTFERGRVQVETKSEQSMGGTSFYSAGDGNVEIARSVDKEKFYQILSGVLNG